jgi:hypothetical protein
VLALEVVGSLMIWAPIPVAWMWVGAHVYDGTGSFAAGAVAWFAGFVATTWFAFVALARLDMRWVALRRRAGHDQADGALTTIVVVSATFALLGFFLWFYVLGQAFVIPFMPSGGG